MKNVVTLVANFVLVFLSCSPESPLLMRILKKKKKKKKPLFFSLSFWLLLDLAWALSLSLSLSLSFCNYRPSSVADRTGSDSRR